MPSFYNFVLTTLLALTSVAAAASSVQPPACLLAALQLLPNPADFSAVCGTEQTYVERNLTKVCTGDDVASAYSAYSATCLASAGMTVKALETASSTTKTGTATAKTTATTLTTAATSSHKTATAGATGTSGATATGSSSAATATATGSSNTTTTTTTTTTSAAGMAAPLPGLIMLSGLLVSGLASLFVL